MSKSQLVRESFQARISIDVKRASLESAAKVLARPRGGWIKTIRIGLGMSATDLASRMKVVPSTIHRLEMSEVAGTINLHSLKKVADEIGCDLVYAFVPRQELESVVKKRALELAKLSLERTQMTMALEQQSLQPDVLKKLIDNKAQELSGSTRLWKDDDKNVD